MWFVASLILFGALLMSRAEDNQSGRSGADQTALVKGNDSFATDLYARLSSQPGNLFFSPYSISAALGMTYLGARGETADQMASTLHFTLDQDRLLGAFSSLRQQLNHGGKPRKYQLHVANALWGQKGYGFREEYLRTTQDAFGAGLREVDFAASEQARQTINHWVEEQTKKKIIDLLPPGSVSPSTRLVLTNAIYFKGAWSHPFAKNGTKQEDFHVSADKKVLVPMMHQTEDFAYFDGPNFQMLELPYQSHELSMLVLLPKKAEEISDFEKQINSKQLDKWRAGLKTHQVTLALPKFKFTAEFTLKGTLSGLGMPLAFSGKADFSGMCSHEKLCIDEVIHKAFVDVNEEGTEAAAATGVTVRALAMRVVPKAIFRADHPFVFVIRDNQTGAILFMGRVSNSLA
jgi:serpin B